jgi:hypothetical protein
MWIQQLRASTRQPWTAAGGREKKTHPLVLTTSPLPLQPTQTEQLTLTVCLLRRDLQKTCQYVNLWTTTSLESGGRNSTTKNMIDLDHLSSVLNRGRILCIFGTKFLRVFLLSFFPPTPFSPSKSCLKPVCNLNIVSGNLKIEHSQDYAQKLQRSCTFMNSASGLRGKYQSLFKFQQKWTKTDFQTLNFNGQCDTLTLLHSFSSKVLCVVLHMC